MNREAGSTCHNCDNLRTMQDLDRALSMIRTTSRALEQLAEADVGGENRGAELVAADAVATLEGAAETICEYLFDVADEREPVVSDAVTALQEGLAILTGYPYTTDVDSPETRACVAARATMRRALHALGAERAPLGDVEISMAGYCNEDGTTRDGEDDGPSEWIVALRTASKETA